MKIDKPLFHLLLTCSLLFFAYAHAEVIPKHLIDVRHLQEGVLPQDNSYVPHGIDVKWKGFGSDKYVCHTSSSGLIDALLMHSYSMTHKRLDAWLGNIEYHRAASYFDAIYNGKEFTIITGINEVKPGDIIAIKYLPCAEGSGHVMIVDSKPVSREAMHPDVEGAYQWTLSVIDCSREGHGPTDSRNLHPLHLQGIGKGTFRIYTTFRGEIIGYTWSTEPDSVFYDQYSTPIAIGRLSTHFLRGQ